MQGNVSEWCQDGFKVNSGNSVLTPYVPPTRGTHVNVYRGGS